MPKISLGNHPTIKRLVQNEIKPRFYPDQPVSPIITARQKVFPIRGGVLAIASCDARVVGREISMSKSPIISPDIESGEALERSREDQRLKAGKVTSHPSPDPAPIRRTRPES